MRPADYTSRPFDAIGAARTWPGLAGWLAGWLAGYGTWERDEYAFDREEDDELEPPVPPGLRAHTAPQHALAAFLRLDDDLLEVAATASPSLDVAEKCGTSLKQVLRSANGE